MAGLTRRWRTISGKMLCMPRISAAQNMTENRDLGSEHAPNLRIIPSLIGSLPERQATANGGSFESEKDLRLQRKEICQAVTQRLAALLLHIAKDR
jgi:hypothetical protein